MNTKKNKQHIIPRIYLKYWKIESNKNFVYGINLKDNYNKNVRLFGLNDKVFKRKKYYNHKNFNNSYIIEDVFGENIEPTYDMIMKEVIREINLSINIRSKIIQWIYLSKMRSTYMRDSMESLTNFILKTMYRMRYNNNNNNAEGIKVIDTYAKEVAKNIQISFLGEEKQVKSLFPLYVEMLNKKQWRILKSPVYYPFWTNINPGFSAKNPSTYSGDSYYPDLNAESNFYFPLSPQYCLEMKPINGEKQVDFCALTMDIQYEQVSPLLVEYINKGIAFTTNEIIISNKKETIEFCVKRV